MLFCSVRSSTRKQIPKIQIENFSMQKPFPPFKFYFSVNSFIRNMSSCMFGMYARCSCGRELHHFISSSRKLAKVFRLRANYYTNHFQLIFFLLRSANVLSSLLIGLAQWLQLQLPLRWTIFAIDKYQMFTQRMEYETRDDRCKWAFIIWQKKNWADSCEHYRNRILQ